MNKLEIKTDRKWKNLLYFYELTEKEKKELDWIEDDTASVFRYRGNVYALDEFMRIPDGAEDLKGWDGYRSDSYFSGIVVKISDDGEQYMAGTYIS